MSVTIKTKEIESVIKAHQLVNQAVLVFGRPGVGKTEEITRVLEETSDHVVRLDGSQMAYEAIQGINYVANEKMGNASYARIKELEDLISNPSTSNSKISMFVDEVSSLEQDDQRTLLNIINDRITPNGIKLGDNVTFVLAANPSAEQRGFANDNPEAAVHLVEQAIVTRCATYVISYTVRDYLDYGLSHNVHPSILQTLKDVPEVFDHYKDESFDSVQVAVPRTLSNLSNLMWAALDNKIQLTEAMIAAFVGLDSPLFYDRYVKSLEKWVEFSELITRDKSARAIYDSMSVTQKGSVILRGMYQAKTLNIKLDDPKNDEYFLELIQDLTPEYLHTLAQIQIQPEMMQANVNLGRKTSEYIFGVQHALNS